MILHNYFRSSTSIRVRIALNMKAVDYEYRGLQLLKVEHKGHDYLAKNPQGLVPALELDDGQVLFQSLAIIEYLDETIPEPPLLPADAVSRARVRAMAMMIACEIHPVNNLRILQTLRNEFGADDEAVAGWFAKWVHTTFVAIEAMLKNDPASGRFCHGDRPGLADICLFSQCVNNQRFDVSIEEYPHISQIFERCLQLDAFAKALPLNQPDAPT